MTTTLETQLLSAQGIQCKRVNYQLTSEELQSITINKKMGIVTESGALAINTGTFTGRSPLDRFIVKDKLTKDKVWWGDINIPIDKHYFEKLHAKMIAYLSDKELYVRDCFACADTAYSLSIRVINEYPWSNLFALNMFLRPKQEELPFLNPEWTVINAPSFTADKEIDGTRQANFSIINFTKKIILIGGTGYTGEIKKGIFSVLNFILPLHKNVMPMHCSANVGQNNDTAIFFGLSGTGKTTLSADASRKLIGDDEHGWNSQNEIFNFEGGCYAKVINLSKEKEPEIFDAIKSGSLLENVVLDPNNQVNYTDSSITPNTRVSYPIDFIKNIKIPSIGKNPKHIFFLTADAFGVLPPISKLNANQAAYHFISGYTAKVAGTEAGVKEPVPSFSACFGAPFMPLHPAEYAEMLSDKIKQNKVQVWLVNTGWTGGSYGVGSRVSLQYTRTMINAVLNGDLGSYNDKDYHIHSVFGIAQPRFCKDVPNDVLSPRASWGNDEAYYKTALQLAQSFRTNFKKFESSCNSEIKKGGPLL